MSFINLVAVFYFIIELMCIMLPFLFSNEELHEPLQLQPKNDAGCFFLFILFTNIYVSYI